MSPMKSIFIHHHLGLGDHIICNGLVRQLLQRESPNFVYLPVRKRNMGTVTQMYCDEKRIVCIPVVGDEDAQSLPQRSMCSASYRIGFERTKPNWDVSFYEFTNIPFDYRWSGFKTCRDINREASLKQRLGITDGERFILVHNQGSDGVYDIDVNTSARIIRVEPITNSLLDWCGLIEQAEEVHCIDSSFIHLAQSFSVKRGLFHKVRQTGALHFALHPSWLIVQYHGQ